MAVEVNIRLKSIEDYIRQAHGRPRALTPREGDQITLWADRMLEHIKSRWPVDTGTSRDRWAYTVDPTFPNMSIRIFNPMFYSDYVHYKGGSPEDPLWRVLVPEAWNMVKDAMLTAVRGQIDLTERAIAQRQRAGLTQRQAALDIFRNPELTEIFRGMFGG